MDLATPLKMITVKEGLLPLYPYIIEWYLISDRNVSDLIYM
jgi:hypothetical protein